MGDLDLIRPDWPAPDNIIALQTTRRGGVSQGGYASLNLARHVGDDPQRVATNRARLVDVCKLPQEPSWLEQTHSTRAINLDSDASRDGDAAFTCRIGQIAVVMTADCLPVLFCARDGSEVAAAHAGWRGLAGGILEQTIEHMHSRPEQLLVWLGPAIGPLEFEVGAEVREVFVTDFADSDGAFVENRPGHFLADLYQLARLRLRRAGITAILGGDHCTYREAPRFFSYRRERTCGRQASLIYIRSNS
jgi:hypothetical protein